jgi:membrane fusion protein (multidrug efflux system)
MVVDKEDKVAERVVTADRAINGEWLITDGLTAGERVVLDGLQKIKPGAPVKTVPAAEQLNAGAQAGVPPEVAQR